MHTNLWELGEAAASGWLEVLCQSWTGDLAQGRGGRKEWELLLGFFFSYLWSSVTLGVELSLTHLEGLFYNEINS